MDHFAGLDVAVKETSVCIVDDTGRIIREVKVASEPEALLQVLKNAAYHFKRIGLEAGPMSQWLYSALAEAGLPVICVETRHMRAVLKAQINKTDRNDARGIAQMMRVGLYRPVHVKTLRSQKLRMLLTHRKLLQSKAIAIRDFKHPDRIVVGSDEPRAREVMSELYRPLYLNRSPIMFTDLRTAALIKYAANAFLATKITFINEIADLAEKVGADVQEVARGIGLDNRIGSKFLHAGPGRASAARASRRMRWRCSRPAWITMCRCASSRRWWRSPASTAAAACRCCCNFWAARFRYRSRAMR
jgi:transposase